MTDREAEKAERERAVFRGFARLAGLPVREGSVESRRPPEPDILCELKGVGSAAFELVELVDSDLAESSSVSCRTGRPAEAVWVGDPTLDQIRRKIEERRYSTAHPMELVAWASRLTTPPSIWIPTFHEPLRQLNRGPFRRLWVVNFGMRAEEAGVWFVNPPP